MHSVKADQPVIVVVLGTYWDGFYILSDRDAVYYGPPKPSEKGKGGGGLGIPMEAIAGITAAVAVVAVLLVVKKRK